ncbi:MAG: ribonuclease HII [Fibrobacter sp.]|jgi:ribonuclease HII|nr:ribonuclease HII [Fibrobacter sp.]
MKFPLPDFLKEVNSPEDGEKILHEKFPEKILIGIDEVGRGPLAGPVVAGAVVLKKNITLPGLNDSKKLTPKKRESLIESVKAACECYAIAGASAEEIDTHNILAATFLAMRRALGALGFGTNENDSGMVFEVQGRLPAQAEVLIAVDGNLKISHLPAEIQLPVVQGDSRIASISAASVLAKVFRDRLMADYAKEYSGYGFEKNAGYGTKLHLDGIREKGLSPIHRKSFKPKSLG